MSAERVKKKKVATFLKIEFIYCKRRSNPILLYVILNMPCLRCFLFLFVHFALLCDRLTPITGLTGPPAPAFQQVAVTADMYHTSNT